MSNWKENVKEQFRVAWPPGLLETKNNKQAASFFRQNFDAYINIKKGEINK